MSYTAVLAFEKALANRGLSASSDAALVFEELLKGGRRKPNAPAELFGQKSGKGPDSFEDLHPHIAGGRFKMVPGTDGGSHVIVGENNQLFHDERHKDLPVYSAKRNLLYPLAKLGWRMQQGLGLNRDTLDPDSDHPSSRHWLPHVYNTVHGALNPSQNGGVLGLERLDMGPGKNQYGPPMRHIEELPGRLTNVESYLDKNGQQKTRDNRSKHAANFVGTMARAGAFIMGVNRAVDAARRFGLDPDDTSPDTFARKMRMESKHLSKFSSLVLPRSSWDEAVGGDYDPTREGALKHYKQEPFFTHDGKGAMAQYFGNAAEHFKNQDSILEHIRGMKVGEATSPEFKNKGHLRDYITPATRAKAQPYYDILGN